MSDTVGVNYQWPAALHLALKTIAAYDQVTVKETLFEAVRRDIDKQVLFDPDLAAALKEAGVRFGDDGYPVLR